MPRQKDGTLHELMRDIDPRKVAEIVDGYGLTAARQRWHWAIASIPKLAEEGRRMKAAGETWTRAKPEPDDVEPNVPPFRPKPPAPGTEKVIARALAEAQQPAPRPVAKVVPIRPAPAPRLAWSTPRIVEIAAPVSAPQKAAPVRLQRGPRWDFPIPPGLLAKKLRTSSVKAVALWLGMPQYRVRAAAELAKKAA